MSEAMDKMIRNECDVVAANRERSGKEERRRKAKEFRGHRPF